MEHFKLKLSLFSTHALKSVLSRPDMIWRTILALMLLGAIAISVARFVSSVWISHSAPAVLPPTSKRVSVTPQDIATTLEVYKEKQDRFHALQEGAPEIPGLSRGSGIVVEEGSMTEEIPLEEEVIEIDVRDGPMP